MDVTDVLRDRMQEPDGFEGMAALSILAQIVQGIRLGELARRSPALDAALAAAAQDTVTDPNCGMTVTVRAETPRVELDGQTYWFCSTGCRDRFLSERSP